MTDEEYIAAQKARLAELKATTHYTADGVKIEAGEWYWNNDLKPVRVTEVAHSFYDHYPLGESDGTQVWHETTDENGRRGSFDSLIERPDIGRLARYWRGKPAGPGATP
jgi:hypothetical protein